MFILSEVCLFLLQLVIFKLYLIPFKNLFFKPPAPLQKELAVCKKKCQKHVIHFGTTGWIFKKYYKSREGQEYSISVLFNIKVQVLSDIFFILYQNIVQYCP